LARKNVVGPKLGHVHEHINEHITILFICAVSLNTRSSLSYQILQIFSNVSKIKKRKIKILTGLDDSIS